MSSHYTGTPPGLQCPGCGACEGCVCTPAKMRELLEKERAEISVRLARSEMAAEAFELWKRDMANVLAAERKALAEAEGWLRKCQESSRKREADISQVLRENALKLEAAAALFLAEKRATEETFEAGQIRMRIRAENACLLEHEASVKRIQALRTEKRNP